MSKIAIKIDDDVMFKPSQMINRVVSILQEERNSTYPLNDTYHQNLTQTVPTDYNHQDNSSFHKQLSVNWQVGSQLTQRNRVICRILQNRPIIRQKRCKYYMPERYLLGESTYPDFCAGFFIALTTDLLPKFQALFKVEEPIWIDDSYLGILQRRVGAVNIHVSADSLVISPSTKLNLPKTLKTGMAVHLAHEAFYRRVGEFLKIDTT